MNLKENIKKIASEQGFLELKVAKAIPFEDEFKYFNDWLQNGFHADMHYMQNNSEKRQNITNVLENAKSVIVLSHPYFEIDQNYKPKKIKLEGKIARFAQGADYHKTIKKKLKTITRYISESYPDSLNKYYVDTGPILEKQWAVRSGIGWQGKNGIIINKKYGSYFFIGIIVTTLEIPPDIPEKDHCGTCSLCLEACPTQAIIQPKIIDANKCISYWTIEAKSQNIPEEISKNLNGWAYGCDICQEICPWNSPKTKLSEISKE